MKANFGRITIAASTLLGAMLFSPTLSQQGLSFTAKADAATRLYVARGFASNANYYTAEGLPWYAVRAYYFGGPWNVGYGYTGWADYAARNAIGCTPGTVVKGGDGILDNCQ